ncbi:MAG: hypothetical protein IPN17_38465 [Deltaproteobacteria bacterium]|nr:hypothetical protein [Deltaproteobacteria bacterium]
MAACPRGDADDRVGAGLLGLERVLEVDDVVHHHHAPLVRPPGDLRGVAVAGDEHRDAELDAGLEVLGEPLGLRELDGEVDGEGPVGALPDPREGLSEGLVRAEELIEGIEPRMPTSRGGDDHLLVGDDEHRGRDDRVLESDALGEGGADARHGVGGVSFGARLYRGPLRTMAV